MKANPTTQSRPVTADAGHLELAAQGTRLAYPLPEAAAMIGIGRTSMYALIDDGEIATVHIGRRRVVPHAALTAYLERRMAESGRAEGEGD